MELSELSLEAVIAGCQQERDDATRGESWACVELFRRAFAGSQEAWTTIQRLMQPLMRRWIGAQQELEVDDVLQEAWLAFARYAPGGLLLPAGTRLGQVIEYLRKTTKTALLTALRKERLRVRQQQLSQLEIGGVAVLVDERDLLEGVETRLALAEQLRTLLQSDQERLVFQRYFIADHTPREIFAQADGQFADVGEINVVIQRLLRRFKKLRSQENQAS